MASRLLIRMQLQADRRGEWRGAAVSTRAGCARNPAVDSGEPRGVSPRRVAAAEARRSTGRGVERLRHSHPKLLILVPKIRASAGG
jgi:hypothetical protein